MCQRFLRSARLYELLLGIDRDLAEQTREAGCPCEGRGRLHSAKYARKPAGGPPIPQRLLRADPDCLKQFSFCCELDGCRKRTRPPSTRFIGRRQFLFATVILVSALACGVTGRRLALLEELYDISRRTVERWRIWWLENFAESEAWRIWRVRFSPPVDEARLPGTILEPFGALRTQAGLIQSLRFLSILGASDHVRRRVLAGPQRTPNDRLRGGT